MSEYQYYEFQAIDRPLTEDEMRELRSCSSRAKITATRFVNHYEWGSFKGDQAAWMEKYFDLFLYLANWGTHELVIRLPRKLLELKVARQYCRGRAASARVKGDFILLELASEEEGGDWEEGSGWLASLTPIRSDLVAGDHRALYLAWLLCVQSRDLAEDGKEPPVPAGLGELTAPLRALADFLRIDEDLLAVAAARSPKAADKARDRTVERWIAALPDAAKTEWLVRLAEGTDPHLRAQLMRQFHDSQGTTEPRSEEPRTVGELLDAAEEIAKERHRKETARMAAEREQRARQEAEARKRYLEDLARREPRVWRQIDELIATKQPARYDEAVKLLLDLRELGRNQGREHEFKKCLLRLFDEHAKKPSLLERLRKAGLLKTRS
jgi:hypothetical protein